MTLFYAAFRAEHGKRFKADIDNLAETAGPVDAAFMPIPEPGEEPWEILHVLEKLRPRHLVLLDPLRREALFPEVASALQEKGCKAKIHCAEHPGDHFMISGREQEAGDE